MLQLETVLKKLNLKKARDPVKNIQKIMRIINFDNFEDISTRLIRLETKGV